MGKMIFLFVAWLACTLGVISLGTTMMTATDTLANVAGVFVLALWGILSFKTGCFVKATNIINKISKTKEKQ